MKIDINILGWIARRCIIRPAIVLMVLPAMVLIGALYEVPYRPKVELSEQSEDTYRQMAEEITDASVAEHLRELCSTPSRMTGTEGYERAVEYIRSRFEAAGLRSVTVIRLPVAVPGTQLAGVLEVPDASGEAQRAVDIFPMWPNLVRTCTLPPDGLAGRLVDGGDGTLKRFNGMEMNSSIVLLDADCDRRWLNVPLLGGAAVIFCGSEKLTREQAELKCVTTPVNVPRFFVSEADGVELRRLAGAGANVRIWCRVDIVNRPAAIVCGVLDGADEQVARETLVLESYFDSVSQVPDLAPGAEAACGIAGLLEAVDRLAAHRPSRSVLFIANGAHYQGQGMAHLVQLLGRRFPGQNTIIATAKQIAVQQQKLADARRRMELCRSEARLLDFAQDAEAGPAQWSSQEPKLRERLVEDIQMAVKGVLDSAYERKVLGDGAWDIERGRRLELQRICWESSIEKLRTQYWREVRAVLDCVRERVRRRDAALLVEIDRLTREMEFLRSIEKLNIRLFLGLELAGGTDSFGMFERGSPRVPPYSGRGPIGPMAERLTKLAASMQEALARSGEPGLAAPAGTLPWFVGGFKPLETSNINPQSLQVAMMQFDVEWCYESNRAAATFCTLMDARRYVDTPYDTLERVNAGNVARQLRLMVPMVKALLDSPEDIVGESNRGDYSGMVALQATTIPRGGAIVPDHPVEGAMVVEKVTDQLTEDSWYFNPKQFACGVRENHLAIADERGRVEFPTRWHSAFVPPPRPFEAYKLNISTGEITFALDRGVSGVERFPNELVLDRRSKEGTLVLFRCRSMALFDLVDPRYMTLLRRMDVIGAEEDSAPLQFGYNLSTQAAYGSELETTGETCAVVYLEPGKRFKVTMSAGLMGLRLALLNMPDVSGIDVGSLERIGEVSGSGYKPDESSRLPLTPWLVARDLWRLDDVRIRNLAERGIRNDLLENLHARAGEWLESAGKAYSQRDYAAMLSSAREAWAYESRAYPLVRSAADDAIKGVIFYLFLLLPFSFFGERLLFGFPRIVHRIIGMGILFVAVFVVLWLTHPAFKLTTSPAMVLLAFITLALSLLVIFLLGGKVAEQFRKLRQREDTRSIDVNRFSSMRTAFLLGISNLRKRPIRSGLTAVTLTLMAFTVVSFTSVKFVPRYNKIDTGKEALYDGVLVKRPQWADVNDAVFDALQALYGDRYAVVPRAWYSGTTKMLLSIPGRRPPVLEAEEAAADAEPAAEVRAWPQVYSLAGFHPRETEVTGLQKLVTGSWFSGSAACECIVPTTVAGKLELTEADIGNVTICIQDREFRLIGIIDAVRLMSMLDLNGEPLTPLDTTIPQSTSKMREDSLGDTYRHFLPEETVLIPFGTLRTFGTSRAGSVRLASVAVAMDPQAARQAASEEAIRRYMASKAVNLYVGIDGRACFYNVPSMMSFGGLKNVAMPLAIAFLIVLNTMLGAVYERHRDIYIFTSVGLAPSHIATLFLAESCVFATIGGVAGYLMGQVFSVATAKLGWLSGLTLNYSSGSVVTAMMVVIGVVIASSLYPAFKASRLASPSVERKWTLPKSSGDSMTIMLPFMVEERYAIGLLSFIGHYIGAHREAGVGRFIAEGVAFEPEGDPHTMLGRIWMAPYDLGVSQNVCLRSRLAEESSTTTGPVCVLELELTRVTGEPRSWRKTNFVFLDGLRKQFLRWRTVGEAERRRFAAEVSDESYDDG